MIRTIISALYYCGHCKTETLSGANYKCPCRTVKKQPAPRGRKPKYPFMTMKVGESFTTKNMSVLDMQSYANKQGRKLGRWFRVSLSNDAQSVVTRTK